MKFPAPFTVSITATFLFSACSSDSTTAEAPAPDKRNEVKEVKNTNPVVITKVTPAPPEVPPAPPAALTDDQRAAALWKEIQGFKAWGNPPGFAGLVEGDSVHGDYVRIYANATAISDLNKLSNGSIIVKEGFHDDQGDLQAITAMKKIKGFSKDSDDWFFTRYDSVGTPSKVNSNSCIRCHKKADGGDFSYAND